MRMPKHRKYTKELLEEAVANSTSVAGVVRYLGRPLAGGTQAHVARKIKDFGIDTSHFLGQAWSRGKTLPPKKSKDEILILLPEGSNRTKRTQLLRAMLESGVDYECRCGLTNEWQGSSLTLEINHINGDWLDNRLQNLEFLCPNCHSQEVHSNMPHKYRQGRLAQLAGGTPLRTVTVMGSSPSAATQKCLLCNKEICRSATYCKACVPKKNKIDWPSLEDLENMVFETSYSEVGRNLGVSDNAVRKAIKRMKK